MKGGREVLTQMHMSLAFFFIFTAYSALEAIQSSLNFESGLGTISISVVYVGYLCSCMFVGAPVVHLITPKWALFFAFFSHTIFIIANVWPMWGTMLPASIILGIASGPYWIAQGTYTTVLALSYSAATNEDMRHVTAKFSSIFHVFFGASKPIGNLITSLVLNRHVQETSNTTIENIYLNDSSYHTNSFNMDSPKVFAQHYFDNSTVLTKQDICGPNHCPYMTEHQQVLEKPDQILIYIMLAILLVFNLLGILTTVCLRHVPATEGNSVASKVISSVTIMKDVNMLLLIVPSILVGIIPGTYYATFSQSVISCTYGIGLVGYTMVSEGIGFTTASLCCGHLTKYVPRIVHNMVALAFFMAVSIWWLFWEPAEDEFWLIVLISVLYGMMHGIYRTHIAGLVSLLFPENPEAGFSQYNIWMGVGFSASFAYTNFLCFTVKMYIFLAVLMLAIVTYLMLEWRIKLRYKELKTDSYTAKYSAQNTLANRRLSELQRHAKNPFGSTHDIMI